MISRRRFIAASVATAVAGPFLMGASRKRELRLGLVADPQFADIAPWKPWINGHNHAGAFGVHDGVPFITLKGMVETENTNAFAAAHLHSDRLELLGHGREPSRELVFRARA